MSESDPTLDRASESDPVVGGASESDPVVGGASESDPVVGGASESDPVVSGAPVDELPEDLQPAMADQEDYVFPNNNRRRVPGYLYIAIGVLLILVVLWRGDAVFVNTGFLGAAGILVVVGIYSIVSGRDLRIDERDALVAAVTEVGFPVGHASAQMGWRGFLSRPTWRVLLYSADEPPAQRGFVLVDGIDGAVIDAFVEANPEDWSDLA